MPAPTLPVPYQFDPTGSLQANRVTNEQHILTITNAQDQFLIVPEFAPYFADSLVITFTSVAGETKVLDKDVDYYCTHWFSSASRACAKPIYGSISILDNTLSGHLTLEYQTLGGDWTISLDKITEVLADRIHNPRVTTWEQTGNTPYAFPVIDHQWDLADLVGMSEVVAKLNQIADAIYNNMTDGLAAHVREQNPHRLTPDVINAFTREETLAKILEMSSVFFFIDADQVDQPIRELVPGKRYLVDSANGTVSANLPTRPRRGMVIEFLDAGKSLATNPLTIIGNGFTIAGSDTLVVNEVTGALILWFDGSQWRQY